MATLLADSPPAVSDERPPASEPSGPEPDSGEATPKQTCAKCGLPMDPEQGWCLECGAAAPGSLSTRTPGWRSTATILGATAILLIGAATAAYAALNNKEAHPATAVVVRAPTATGTTPTTGTAQAPPPATTPSTATTTSAPPPKSTYKPPKIPLAAATPKPAATSAPVASSPTKSTPTASTPTTVPSSTPAPPPAIVLDTNAVSTYNPDNYPASDFGEPSLTIDGETSTAWTAPVYPDIAPKMAVGLVVDLRAPQKLSSLELISSTPGMTVQVFAANGSAPPATINDPAWVKLTKPTVNKKRHQAIKLGDSTKGFRFVVLWISRAPASSVGTPQAPGRVSVNEIELFPAK